MKKKASLLNMTVNLKGIKAKKPVKYYKSKLLMRKSKKHYRIKLHKRITNSYHH